MPPRPPIYRPPGKRLSAKAAKPLSYDKRRGSSTARGYDRKWRAVRDLKLTQTPYCEPCDRGGITTIAGYVDHKIPLTERPDLRLELSNLESMCSHCHNSTKQLEEREWRASGRPGWLEPSRIPVDIVCGPIASGKSTWAHENAGARGLIIDLDVIACHIAGIPFTHAWDRAHLDAALRERNALLAALSRPEAPYRWSHAILIVSEAKADGRAWWQEKLSARSVVVMATPADRCFARLAADPDRHGRLEPSREAIAYWWQTYEPRPGEVVVQA